MYAPIEVENFNYDITIFFLELSLKDNVKDFIASIPIEDIIAGYNRFCEKRHEFLEIRYNYSAYYKLIMDKSDELKKYYNIIDHIVTNAGDIMPADEQVSHNVRVIWYGVMAILLEKLYSDYRAQYKR